jgi:serine/threonine-protein kinase HSL1 (negative regulator of Swe1 kinase)
MKRANEPSQLMVIDEDSTLLTTPTIVRKKRSGWFGRNRSELDTENTLASSALAGLESKPDSRQSQTIGNVPTVTSPAGPAGSASSSEFPIRKPRFGAGKKGFSRWIGKIGRDRGIDTSTTEAGKSLTKLMESVATANLSVSVDVTPDTIPSRDSGFSSSSPTPSSNDAPPTSGGPEQSWFARFFKMKPAVQILCFNISRGRARQELVILLKEWRRHGIRDLEYSRENNTITARVDKINSLEIKPVTFRIELFVVLEHGRKVDLSIARFVQVKGAVSGFRRVLDVMDGVMKGRSWLVEDEDKWRALCEVVGS